jgi:hypothetical protein
MPYLPPGLRPRAGPKSRAPPPAALSKFFKISANALKRMGSLDEEGRICALDVKDALSRVPVLFVATGLHQHWTHTPKSLFERVSNSKSFGRDVGGIEC